MGLDRDRWKEEFRTDSTLTWPCPACNKSPLRLVASSLKDGETAESKTWQANEASEPGYIAGRFSCLMDCAHCGNVVGVTGSYRVQDDRHWDPQDGESGDYEKYYKIAFFTESPRLIEIPDDTPQAVVTELQASFQLYWQDSPSCANRLRSAVEKLLTAEGIPQTNGKVGRRQFLPLHVRIERFRAHEAQIADALMAAKWIGNAGSHASRVTLEDTLDAYELLDWVLNTLYAKRHRRAASLTKAVNRRRGPRSRRRG